MAAMHRQRPRGRMRQRILQLAGAWFRQRGYHGFSFGQLAEALEVQRSAIHYHFPGKADLATALFRAYRNEFAEWRAQIADEHLEPDEQIARLMDFETRQLDDEQLSPLSVAAVEYASLPSGACAEAEGLRDDLLDWLMATLNAGRATGQLDFPGDAGDQAGAIIAAVQGALELARIHGRSDFAAVRRAILAGVMPRGV